MVTEDGEDVQRAEKVGLKRKLTGPPRLLLGKTRTRSVGEDRPEAKTDEVDEPVLKSPTAATESEVTDLTETPNMEEEFLSAESCRGRHEVRGEDCDVTYRKVNRPRWWRRFSSVVVCTRRQKKNVEESLEKKEKASVNHTEETNQSACEEKRRFNVMFRRFQTSSDVRTREQNRDSVGKDGDRPSLTFQKKLRRFFTRAGRSRSSAVPQENPEDRINLDEAPSSPDAEVDERTKTQREEALCPPDDQVEECIELPTAATDPSSEAVMVTAEMSITASENRAAAESPESPTEELRRDIDNTEERVMDAAAGSGTTQTDTDTADSAAVGRPVKVVSLDKDEGFSTEFVLDRDDHLSASPVSSEVHNEKTPQPSTNGPSIRIELVPPDNAALQDEEEEEEWEGRSSENQNHLLLLLGFDHREQQLLQTARSLVRAAMNAAVDQLGREQQGGSESVHREPQGCRDHA